MYALDTGGHENQEGTTLSVYPQGAGGPDSSYNIRFDRESDRKNKARVNKGGVEKERQCKELTEHQQQSGLEI